MKKIVGMRGLGISRPRGSSGYNGGVMFQVRPFRKADFETLWRIDQVCFEPQLAYSRPEMAFYMRRAGAFTLVAEAKSGVIRPAEEMNTEAGSKDSAAIVGFIVAELQRREGHIITIDVVAEARRSGVGSALLDAAENELRQAGAETVTLETAVNNEAAIRFYKQKGYFVEKTVCGYYSNQLDALVLEKELVAD
jgi:ribosomal-protein-alanine N-acetyltransferase